MSTDPLTATAVTATVVSKALENIVDDLYALLKATLGTRFKGICAREKIGDLYLQITKVRMVKTLWQVDRPVDILSFYCPCHVTVQVNATPTRTRVDTVGDLPSAGNVLIEGIAGQGKSILLRYLCSQELTIGKVIPIFIELRRIQSGETLLMHIRRFFEILQIDVDEPVFRALATSGKIMIFLDGFDELVEDDRTRILNEIEYLSSRDTRTRFIVTSRPESGIQMSALFNVVKLDTLNGDEYKQVVYRLAESTELAEAIFSQVEEHKGQLRELLCTPLMVTLLLLTYKSYQQLPAQMSDFYESIFPVLLQRHDGTKPGYKRPRRCRMNDTQYRTVFDTFSFESKRKVRSIFSSADVYDFAKRSLKKAGLKEDPSHFIQDIIGVTCLLLKEGEEHRFIHRSVQEYFAASYVRSKPDSVVKAFYQHCSATGFGGSWRQELCFLSEIDKYRYTKYFFLPFSCRKLGIKGEKLPWLCPSASHQSTKDLFGKVVLGFEEGGGGKMPVQSFTYRDPLTHDDISKLHGLDFSPAAQAISRQEVVEPPELQKERTSRRRRPELKYSLYVEQLLDKGIMTKEFQHVADQILRETYDAAKQAAEYTAAEEACELTVKFEM